MELPMLDIIYPRYKKCEPCQCENLPKYSRHMWLLKLRLHRQRASIPLSILFAFTIASGYAVECKYSVENACNYMKLLSIKKPVNSTASEYAGLNLYREFKSLPLRHVASKTAKLSDDNLAVFAFKKGMILASTWPYPS